MPVWRRYLVRDASGRMVELPSRALDKAEDGTSPLPGFAGRCVDVVAAVLVGERGQSPQVAEVSFTKLYFDNSGFVDPGKRERMIRLMLESVADKRIARIPNAARAEAAVRAGAARLQLADEFAWQPGPAEMNEVMLRLDHRPAGQGHTVH